MKSAAAALVRREENGYFQELEIPRCRSLKIGSFLLSGLECAPMRKRSSSFEARDSWGSSGQSSASFSVARESTSTSSELATEGRASWPLGGSASAKAGPKSSESEAAVCRTSSSPREMKSRAFGQGNRKSCKNSTGEFARARSGEGGRERKGEACLLTLHLLELDIRTPAISWGDAEVLDARRGEMEDSRS